MRAGDRVLKFSLLSSCWGKSWVWSWSAAEVGLRFPQPACLVSLAVTFMEAPHFMGFP